ncbi:Ku protein [Microlunatus panaciterrae]|uniref:Non-homologous end joining protein Ku n=1 Tax=Microlunatus panaciterrae TaxID=400768 RepID=A0ABS2RN26_9ACTN|nr:Ku protein [Microlunatus panaciterrae]MBM7800406.1 DNA end-binding protein Ku [Microlunatus panaciterrae]
MRSIWKGSIAFGLVNVPVRVYSATEDHDLELHQVHDKDGGRIRYQRRCEVCGRQVDYDHIDKAYEHGDQTVVLTEDDLSVLPEERSREIEVLEFVPSSQIDPIMFARSYFLVPDAKAVKAYALLRRTLSDTDQTAVVQFTLRRRTRLGALRVRGKVLLLQGLLWDDEVREAEFPELDENTSVSSKEREMAASLVQTLSGEFTPEKFTDEYQDQLHRLVEAKLEQGAALDTEATFGRNGEEEGGEVVDLMEALRRSVENSRTSRGGGKKPAKKAAKKAASSTAKAGRKGASTSGTTRSGSTRSGSAQSGSSKSGRSGESSHKTAPSKRSKRAS